MNQPTRIDTPVIRRIRRNRTLLKMARSLIELAEHRGVETTNVQALRARTHKLSDEISNDVARAVSLGASSEDLA